MKKIFYIMKKVKYVIFCTIVFYACTNSEQQEKILELEKENKLLIEIIDSLKQTDAFKFNEIFSKESGRPDDTALIKEYRIFLDSANAVLDDELTDEQTFDKTFFWSGLVSDRIYIIEKRVAAEKELFGEWEWFETTYELVDISTKTPLTENKTRKIVINEDYTIQYFENGIKTKQDSFYTTIDRFYPFNGTNIHFVNQNETKSFIIYSKKHNDILGFHDPWRGCLGCPYEKYKRIKTKKNEK